MDRAGSTRRSTRTMRTWAVTACVVSASVALLAPAVTGAATAGSATDDAAIDDGAARALLAYVPEDVRADCRVDDPADPDLQTQYGASAQQLVATVSCTPDGVDRVYYDQFSDPAVVPTALFAAFPAATDPSGDFGTCPAASSYERDDVEVGTVVCTTETEEDDDELEVGGVSLTWSYPPAGIIVQTLSNEGDVDAVWKYFTDIGGPNSESSDAGLAPAPTQTGLADAGDELFTHLPKQARTSCDVVDTFDSETLQSAYAWWPFIVADVEECTFQKVIEGEYFRFSSTAVMKAYADAHGGEPTGKRVAWLGSFECPGKGTFHEDTKGSTKKVGTWLCTVQNKDADADSSSQKFVSISWTNEPLKVYAFGATPVKNAKTLLEWFANDAGPQR